MRALHAVPGGRGTKKWVERRRIDGRVRAVVHFHPETEDSVIRSEFDAVLALRGRHEFSHYLPAFFGLVPNGKRFAIIREWLPHTLSEIAPLRTPERFAAIARDLCRGLCCIHERGFVLRELKLENCGVNRRGVAMIFDLDTMAPVAEGRAPVTMLTRPPELMQSGPASTAADVWALGATLFALRTGAYPFVGTDCLAERRRINAAVAAGLLSEAEAKVQRWRTDAEIRAKAEAPAAAVDLRTRVERAFVGGGVRAELMRMLAFDLADRRPAREHAVTWNQLALTGSAIRS